MSKKFANKVIAERLVLSNVNEYTHGSNQLTGLTIKSIDLWTMLNGLEKNSGIELVLREISEICHRMTDRSKETFESIDDNYLEAISQKLQTIQTPLKEMFGKRKF